jgi:hypothetical protein
MSLDSQSIAGGVNMTQLPSSRHRFISLLLAKSRYLASKGWFIIGDSAYSLCQFLITPFDNVRHGLAEDNFNFFQSSARIYVECAFSEIDAR